MSKLKHIIHDFYPGKPVFTEKDYPDLSGKVYIVTGSTTGIGLEVAKLLAGTKGKVYVHGRSQEKADKAKKTVQEAYPSADVHTLVFDLADLPTVKPGIETFLKAETRLDGIVLNAGVMMPPKGSVTKQDYELQLGTNNIGHQLVMRLLDEIILQTAKENPAKFTRIVWVSSDGHALLSPPNGVNWDTTANKPAGIDEMSPGMLYGQTKAINIIQSYQWAKNHKDSNILSVAVHPGVLATDVARHFNPGPFTKKVLGCLMHPPKSGAYTELYSLLYPDTKVFDVFEDGPIYVSPWGTIKRDLLRNDVNDTAKGGLGEKVWEYLNEQTEKYV